MKEKNEKIMDYLSCPLDDVVDREKKSGKNSLLKSSSTKKSDYKKSSIFSKKRDSHKKGSSFRGRRSGFISRKSGSFKKPYYNNRLINKTYNNYKGRNVHNGREYFKGRSGSFGSRVFDNRKGSFKKRFTSNRNKASVKSFRGNGSNNKGRKSFNKAPTSRTVVTKRLNNYKTAPAPMKKFNNLNISLFRKNRTFALNTKRSKPVGTIKSNVPRKRIKKGLKKGILKSKTRKSTSGSKFKPLNKYFLSKIKIVTSLNKIPSPLKEQKNTEVNLPESLNNTTAKKN
ncbi:hypothetical protein PGSY75_0210900 [Plasmodium gaboni]|uniref:Uncharacterized protein n=1 Tax=Plasmodium gaboni TaxID=647221 RepID=A0A151LWM2_9APIC|nr:hypothetical protein PGSY75_0210900 [Plasmodium gaboni]KYO03542.1 hypothetical protein PGSY75_0210900 [Plasmodium gaboni]SOV20669.1 conserved Plasmodium protein, unknown function [Plasmodium sp. DRC-Itaito]